MSDTTPTQTTPAYRTAAQRRADAARALAALLGMTPATPDGAPARDTDPADLQAREDAARSLGAYLAEYLADEVLSGYSVRAHHIAADLGELLRDLESLAAADLLD